MSGFRIENQVARGRLVSFTFENVTLQAHEGEGLAAALSVSGVLSVRRAPADQGPRGAFCFMGTCQECVVLIKGERTESCRVAVREGLEVRAVR